MKLENVITKNEFDDMLKEGCVLQSSELQVSQSNYFKHQRN